MQGPWPEGMHTSTQVYTYEAGGAGDLEGYLFLGSCILGDTTEVF